ncbi:hypothetical protein GCM10009117_04360 [Gangjinia marincola]|uniref:Lipid/polyisoprenoid-binding YceI-like domain-containing protein n=1 Tax=Gangjinia marincola TaxID=578463 RepID=A0ABP3XSF9_9FLAO
MKKVFVHLFVASSLMLGVTSCKDGNKETETSAAEEVAKAEAAAVDYTVNTDESIINWVGSKPTEDHTGTIKLKEGQVSVQENKLQSGMFVVDMTSINVTDLEGDEKASLEGHLKGSTKEKEDHFFNVSQYPTAKFEVTGISENDGQKMLSGNLTMKGKTKNISIPVTTTFDGNKMMLTSDEFMINRTEWGVNYASKSVFDDLKDNFVNDDIKLKISLVANKA